jgi:nanoRNase/pAp phosphatase (c-di-AMP/oligoRNAs hydrolase)
LIDEADEIVANVRSGDRRVLRWSPTGEGEACFTGDLGSVETYRCADDSHAVTAVIDIEDGARAEAALRALRTVRPDAAVLVLSQAVDHAPGDGTLTRAGTLRDVLRLDLEEELRRLEAERRAYCLRRFIADEPVVPIMIHPDPDPDAISSALAVRVVLDGNGATMPIVSLGTIRRPENRGMADLLGLDVAQISREEVRDFRKLICVDMQPVDLIGPGNAVAVIDHHPAEPGYTAQFLDVRSDYGAAASMMTEYLRATGADLLDELLATALLHGIKTDTDSLARGVSPADVEAYAFLQEHADLDLLRRIERPELSIPAVHRIGCALSEVCAVDGVVHAHAGELPSDWAHLPAELADFCIGVENAAFAVVTALVDDKLVFTVRYSGKDEEGAGALARGIAAAGGKGGGHATMARAALPRERAEELIGDINSGDLLLRFIRQQLDAADVNRRS